MATTANCAILAGVTTRIAEQLTEHTLSRKIILTQVCSDGTSIPSNILSLEYTIKYTTPYVHRLPQ